MIRTVVALFALVSLTGCLRPAFKPTSTKLDEAIFYREQSGADWISLSGPDAAEHPSKERPDEPAVHVPDPALVDIDSKVHIYVDKNRVALEDGGQALDGRFEKIKTERERLSRILTQVEAVTRTRQKAIDSLRNDTIDASKMFDDFDSAEFELIETIEAEFTDQFDDIDAAAARHPGGTYAGLADWFRRQIESLDADYAALEKLLEDEVVSLRLEAWLVQGDRLTPIHVDKYDKLDEQQIQHRDRFGLDLAPAQRQQLDAELKANARFAEKANQVLDGEREVIEALLEVLSDKYAKALEKADALVQEYSTTKLRRRAQELKTKSKAFWDELKNQADALTGQAKTQLEGLPATFDTWLQGQDSSLIRVIGLVSQAIALKDAWSNVTADNLADTIARTQTVVGELRNVSWPDLAADAKDKAEAFLRQEAGNMLGAASMALTGLLSSAAGQGLLNEFEAIYSDIKDAKGIIDTARDGIVALIGKAEQNTATFATIPQSFKVPYEQLGDTSIDLRRTSRKVGDTVKIRATRYKNDEQVDQSTAEFEVQRFGWYARLSPAVVLVAPERLASGNDNFRFAPTLSWLHHYMPRPGAGGSDFMAAMRPAIGIHSAFLNFDTATSDAIQIGLGGTFSLWHGRLQFGGGYNLMADSRDDGQFYYFVGTDLIGLLQTAGMVSQ